MLEAWCSKPALQQHGGATVAGVCAALDQARLTYHAGAVRAMTGLDGELR